MSEREFHHAEDAEERGEGICRTCLAPIWNEGGTVGHIKRAEGWSDRIERGGDSLVCFKAIDYRHVPLVTREAAIYDRAVERGIAVAADLTRQAVEQALAPIEALVEQWDDFEHDVVTCLKWDCGACTMVNAIYDLRAAVEQARGGA